jgi:epoxyqueuosine reductase QueG
MAPEIIEAAHKEKIISFLQDWQIDLFGIADIGEIKKDFHLADPIKNIFPLAIVLGRRVLSSVLEEIIDQPTQLYFHHYRQLNNELDRLALRLALFLEKEGFQALPIPASQIIDWKNQRAHLSHKKVGYLAGLGWIGRNNLLVNPVLGSRFRLVTVLTDIPLEPDSPITGDCGSCLRCLNVCPAQAIHENPADFDHLACFRKLDEFRRRGLVSQHICGICVKACVGPDQATKR